MKNREAYLAKRRVKREKIRSWLRALKNAPCADCKQVFDPVCMDFDHRDPSSKSFEIGRNANEMNMEKLKAEIEKCDVVCSNCHRIRSKSHLGWS